MIIKFPALLIRCVINGDEPPPSPPCVCRWKSWDGSHVSCSTRSIILPHHRRTVWSYERGHAGSEISVELFSSRTLAEYFNFYIPFNRHHLTKTLPALEILGKFNFPRFSILIIKSSGRNMFSKLYGDIMHISVCSWKISV